MKFKTVTIKGYGRGKGLGYPTINMEVLPELVLSLREGIYAARVTLKGDVYTGALFFGPVPVFGQKEKSLEIHVLNVANLYVGIGVDVEIEIVSFIREVQDFSSVALMLLQMDKDIIAIQKVFGQHE